MSGGCDHGVGLPGVCETARAAFKFGKNLNVTWFRSDRIRGKKMVWKISRMVSVRVPPVLKGALEMTAID